MATTDKTVMQHKNEENPMTFEELLYQEYLKAVENGFQGTKEEYFRARDYT